jgi:hypothetical protein
VVELKEWAERSLKTIETHNRIFDRKFSH